jgi:hypothetical protein
MRVVTRCVSLTVGLWPSVAQVESAFGRVVAERASCLPEFELLTRLGIFTSIRPWHHKPKRSSRQGACYILVPVPYRAWIAADWPTRVDLMAAAFLAGLEEVPQKRLLDSERSALRNIAESTRVDARSSPPARIEKIVPTFLDISPVAPAEERLFKLYKRIDGRLHYRESWIGDHHVVTEHWGTCGERGTVRTHRSDSGSAARKKYNSLKAEARAMGFRRIMFRRFGCPSINRGGAERRSRCNHIGTDLAWPVTGQVIIASTVACPVACAELSGSAIEW